MGGTAYAGRIRVLGATLRKKNERKRARMTILRQGSTSAISTLKLAWFVSGYIRVILSRQLEQPSR